MMGTKLRNFAPLPDLSLDELVPKDNFYRCLEGTVDLSFVSDLVEDRYAPSGRPSVDSVVFFKLHLVLFFEGLRPDRLPGEGWHLRGMLAEGTVHDQQDRKADLAPLR